MTIKDLKELINKYPDNKEVLFRGEDGWVYSMGAATLMNVEEGEILSEEGDKNFNKNNSCVVLW